MIISEANLALRFYVSDGWTRSKVAALSDDVDLYDVLPRYYGPKDDISNNGTHRFEIDGEFDDCSYFAVYNKSKWWVPKEVMDQHELNEFRM